jgi:hypothetical protein
MVALEPGEPLLLYIMATTEVMSMVLVAERPEPKQPRTLKRAPVAGSRSQDPDPTKGSHDQETSGSHLPEPTLSLEPQIGSWLSKVPSGLKDQEAFGSQILKPTLGPNSQHTTVSQLSEVPSGPGGQEPPAPEPMEIDPLDTLGRVWTVQ